MNRRELLQRAGAILGGVASGALSQAVLAGVDGRTTIQRPVFSAIQRDMTTILTEMIIPETDSPGAIAAGVPHFVELMVSDWYTETERSIYMAGLETLDEYCRENFGAAFVACSEEQQITGLEQAEHDSRGYKSIEVEFGSKDQDEDVPFFKKLKELTVLGYFTSEVGAKQELSYDPMPMTYDGDFDFADIGRQWSS